MPYLYNSYNLEALFKSYLISENVSEVTLRNYLSDLRYFLGWLNEYANSLELHKENQIQSKDMFQNLNTDAVAAFRTYLREENKLPEKSINRRLSTVRKFCSFAILQGWLTENPAKKIANLTETSSGLKSIDEFVESEQKVNPNVTEDITEFISIIN